MTTDKIDPKNLVVGDTYPIKGGTATIIGFPAKEDLAKADAIRDKAMANKRTMQSFYAQYNAMELEIGKDLRDFWAEVGPKIGMTEEQTKDDKIMVDDTTGAVVRLVFGPPAEEPPAKVDSPRNNAGAPAPEEKAPEEEAPCCGDNSCN